MSREKGCVLLILLSAAVIISSFFILYASAQESSTAFLAAYGWKVDPIPEERAEITIPKPFDRVYESYNALQLSAGLDLTPYQGCQGVRYTYRVRNYPVDVGEPIYATVICIDETPVAGDIMTRSIYGFIHALNEGQHEILSRSNQKNYGKFLCIHTRKD